MCSMVSDVSMFVVTMYACWNCFLFPSHILRVLNVSFFTCYPGLCGCNFLYILLQSQKLTGWCSPKTIMLSKGKLARANHSFVPSLYQKKSFEAQYKNYTCLTKAKLEQQSNSRKSFPNRQLLNWSQDTREKGSSASAMIPFSFIGAAKHYVSLLRTLEVLLSLFKTFIRPVIQIDISTTVQKLTNTHQYSHLIRTDGGTGRH